MTCGIAVSIVVSCKHILDHVHLACCHHMHAWAAWHNTCLLMKLMPKGVGLTSLFLVFFLSPCLVFLFFLYASTQACSCCLVRRHEADLLIIYNVKFLTQHFRLSQPYWVWICAFGQTPGEDCCLCHDMRLPLAIFAGRHHISGTLVPSAGKRSCTRHPLLFAHV